MFAALLFLLSAFAFLGSVPVAKAAWTTVATSTTSDATLHNFQGQVFHANGYYWVFYFDGLHEGYVSSADGGTWSAETTLTTSCAFSTGEWAFTVSGTTVYRVCASQGDTFYVDTGTLGSGTITWGTESGAITKVKTGNIGTLSSVSTALDSSGKWWVVAPSTDGTDYFLEAWDCSSGCLTASNWSDSNAILISSTYWPIAKVTALTSGRLSVVYAFPTPHALHVETFDGSAWSSVATTSATDYTQYFSCVAIGDVTECAAPDGTDSLVAYLSVAYDANSPAWSSETNLSGATCAGGNPDASISTNGTSKLVVYFSCEGTSTYYTASIDSGSSWSSVTTDATAETTTYDIAASFAIDSSGFMQAVWTSGSGTSYDIRFSNVGPGVTESFNVKTADSGPSATIGISGGCGLTNSSFTGDGSNHTYYDLTPSCSVTLTEPTDTASTRFRFAGNHTSLQFTTCGAGSCAPESSVNYYQYYLTMPSSGLTVSGDQFGTATAGTVSSGFYDYHATLAVTSLKYTSDFVNDFPGWVYEEPTQHFVVLLNRSASILPAFSSNVLTFSASLVKATVYIPPDFNVVAGQVYDDGVAVAYTTVASGEISFSGSSVFKIDIEPVSSPGSTGSTGNNGTPTCNAPYVYSQTVGACVLQQMTTTTSPTQSTPPPSPTQSTFLVVYGPDLTTLGLVSAFGLILVWGAVRRRHIGPRRRAARGMNKLGDEEHD